MSAATAAVEPARALLRVAGLCVLAGVVAGAVAAAYRWYVRERAPAGLCVLAGLSTVAVVLNTTAMLGQVLGGATGPLAPTAVAFNGAAFAVAGLAAALARRAGDRLATDASAVAGTGVAAEVGPLVRAVGRLVAVELPAEVEDVEGYDPVSPEVKAQLAGRTLLFPRGLTVAELTERLETRLVADHDVGYADAEVTADGTVEYLALGSRVAGLGPTLGPGAAAVAVAADPPNSASPGDLVGLWEPGPEPARVATGEVRATADDVVTLAVDAADATALAGGDYRLVTLPAGPRPEREFAALLRAADETMGAVAVAAGSPLAGAPVGSLAATVVAVRPGDGPVEPVPSRSRTLSAGDTIYVVARPDVVRRVEAAAAGDG